MVRSPIEAEHIKQLEWAVWFCQVDLKTLTEGDWINLNDNLVSFLFHSNARVGKGILGISRLINLKGGGGRIRTSTREEIEKLQRALSNDLKALAYDPSIPRSSRMTNPISDVSLVVEARGPVSLTPFSYGLDLGGHVQGGYNATNEMRVRAAFFEYLVRSGILGQQLRICPECKRIFILKRRPRVDMEFHCSLRCSRLAATRRYREKLSKKDSGVVRAKERERSHGRYVAKQQRKYGPNVKVDRRPRQQNKP
jgi:hypothetical protein